MATTTKKIYVAEKENAFSRDTNGNANFNHTNGKTTKILNNNGKTSLGEKNESYVEVTPTSVVIKNTGPKPNATNAAVIGQLSVNKNGVQIIGGVSVAGKVTSNATASTDSSTTLVTKGYIQNTIDNTATVGRSAATTGTGVKIYETMIWDDSIVLSGNVSITGGTLDIDGILEKDGNDRVIYAHGKTPTSEKEIVGKGYVDSVMATHEENVKSLHDQVKVFLGLSADPTNTTLDTLAELVAFLQDRNVASGLVQQLAGKADKEAFDALETYAIEKLAAINDEHIPTLQRNLEDLTTNVYSLEDSVIALEDIIGNSSSSGTITSRVDALENKATALRADGTGITSAGNFTIEGEDDGYVLLGSGSVYVGSKAAGNEVASVNYVNQTVGAYKLQKDTSGYYLNIEVETA